MRLMPAAGALALAGALWPSPQLPSERVRVVLVGDSTVAEGGGWGPGFRAAMGSDVDVTNLALNGRSSKSFLDEGAWAPARDARPAYVLIQFGHNDQRGKGADRETEAATTYRANLTRFIDDTRAMGAMPILVTSITRRNLTPEGKVKTDALLPYVEEVRRLAADKRVLLMDLYALTVAQCERLGTAGCEALDGKVADGSLDTTHLSALGQREVGAIAAKEFLRAVLPAQPGADPKSITAATLLPLDKTRTTFPMPEPRNPQLPSLIIIGDSTVRHDQGDGAGDLWGWGDPVAAFFDTSKINVVNRAISGMSSRTYITLGHWDRVVSLLKPGDILIMQFGHNDASAVNDPTRARGSLPGVGPDMTDIDNQMTGERETVHTYGWYLTRLIGDAKRKGATVVVCSPVPRRAWKDGRVVRTDTYRSWAASTARSAGAAFIDLNEIVARRYEALGPDAVAALFPSDNTHTSRAGAEIVAAGVIEGLKGLHPNPLGAFFSAAAR